MAIANRKGGADKSTTAVHLSVALGTVGYRFPTSQNLSGNTGG